MIKYKGRIVDIEKYSNNITAIKTGVKGYDQHKYKNYPGGNGTYVTGGMYLGVSLDIKIYIFDLDKSITFDVYEDVLSFKNKKKISSKLLEEIMDNQGKKVDITTIDGKEFFFDISQLF